CSFEKRVTGLCFFAPLVGMTEKSIGAMGTFLFCWLSCWEIQVGPIEEGPETEGEVAMVEEGKNVETRGGWQLKE
ncbi:hypothetical protein KI387_018425, partial [Taxus chinensis]